MAGPDGWSPDPPRGEHSDATFYGRWKCHSRGETDVTDSTLATPDDDDAQIVFPANGRSLTKRLY